MKLLITENVLGKNALQEFQNAPLIWSSLHQHSIQSTTNVGTRKIAAGKRKQTALAVRRPQTPVILLMEKPWHQPDLFLSTTVAG